MADDPSTSSGQVPSTSSGQVPSTSSGQVPSTSSGQVPSGNSGQVPIVDDNTGDTPRNLLLKLRTLPLFASLTEDQFKTVVNLLRTEQVPRSTLLIQQGGLNTNLYILRRGRGMVRALEENDNDEIIDELKVGSIFNEAAFLTGMRNPRTVEALEALTLWYIPRDAFQELLLEQPDLEANLRYPDSLPISVSPNLHRRRATRFDWQHANEHIVHFSRKHPWVFWRSLWPVLLAIGLIYAMTLVASGDGEGTLARIVQALIGLFTLASLAYILYTFVNWHNDYYVVTDQRLIHRERTPFTRDEQSELPMSKIQNVGTDRPGLLSWLMDYGDVTIDASGARAKVRFNDVAKPDVVVDRILSQSTRIRQDSRATQRAKMRSELVNELKIIPPAQDGSAAARKHPAKRRIIQRSRSSLGDFRNTLAPRMRIVQGDSVIYRKHWMRLIEVVSVPVLGVLVYVALLIVVRVSSASLAALLFGTPIVVGIAVLGIGLLAFVVYRYEDWRNDIYIVTPDRIVDIDRAPFGLGRSSKREARLSAVQNVNSEVRGVWDNAFNMGDVIVQTAGAEGTLTFERVHDPRSIQRDILDRIETLDARIREAQMTERRHEFAQWVGIYDELKRLYGDTKPKP